MLLPAVAATVNRIDSHMIQSENVEKFSSSLILRSVACCW